MPHISLPEVPFPQDISDHKKMMAHMKQIYLTLAKWRTIIASTNLTGGQGIVTISESAPTSTDGEENDIWIKR